MNIVVRDSEMAPLMIRLNIGAIVHPMGLATMELTAEVQMSALVVSRGEWHPKTEQCCHWIIALAKLQRCDTYYW